MIYEQLAKEIRSLKPYFLSFLFAFPFFLNYFVAFRAYYFSWSLFQWVAS